MLSQSHCFCLCSTYLSFENTYEYLCYSLIIQYSHWLRLTILLVYSVFGMYFRVLFPNQIFTFSISFEAITIIAIFICLFYHITFLMRYIFFRCWLHLLWLLGLSRGHVPLLFNIISFLIMLCGMLIYFFLHLLPK